MIDWIAQNTIPSSILLLIILASRTPIKNLLGAHISYALWMLPIFILIGPTMVQSMFVEEQWLALTSAIQPQILQNLSLPTIDNNHDWLLIAWVLGLALTASLKAWKMVQFNHHALLNARPIDSKLWQLKTGRVNIAYSDHVQSPCISGLVFPTIYLPSDFESNYSQAQQKLIILHEIQHHKKGDLWLLLVAEIYCCLFWFNPLAHFSKRFFIADQELACDRQVLKDASQQTRLDYGQALHQGLLTQLSPMALSFFTVKHERFIMLNKHQNNTTKTVIGFSLMALLTFTASVFSHDNNINNATAPEVSFNFTDIPLPIVIQMIADATEQDERFINSELLEGKVITTKADHANVFEVLDDILNEQGLKVSRTETVWTFSNL